MLTQYDLSSYQTHHSVSVDASYYNLGAVLRKTDGRRLPVADASKYLANTETRCAQIVKHALVVPWACEPFRSYLLDLQFHVETNHRPLVSLF